MEIADRNLKNKCSDSIHILPSIVKNLAGILVLEKYNILYWCDVFSSVLKYEILFCKW